MKIPNPPAWTVLRQIGGSRLVTSSHFALIVVPVLANSSVHIPQPLLDQLPLHIKLNLPFSWVLLFWAAFSFSIAQLIYLLACPKIISKFRFFDEFEKSGYGVIDLLLLAHPVLSGQTEEDKENCRHFLRRFCNQKDLTQQDSFRIGGLDRDFLREDSLRENSLREAFSYVRHVAEISRYWARLVFVLLTGFGFALLGRIAVQNAFFVWRYMFQ